MPHSEANYEFKRGPGLFMANWLGVGLVIEATRIVSHSDHRSARIRVRMDSGQEVLNLASNISGPRARGDLARALQEIVNVPDNEATAGLDRVKHFIEIFCADVENALEETVPAVRAANQFSPVHWLLKPMLATGKPTILLGAAQSLKSYLATFLCLLLENGEKFETLQPSAKIRTLYLDWESDADDMAERCVRLKHGLMVVDLAVYENPHYLRMTRPLMGMIPEIAKEVTKHTIQVIVVDSLGPACGSDMQKEDTPTAFFNATREIGKDLALPLTWVLIAHLSKEELRKRHGTHLPYGNIYFWNLARLVWEMKRAPGEDRSHTIIGMLNTKNNVGPIEAPLGLEFVFDEEDISTVLQMVDPKKSFIEAQSQPDQVLDLLKDGAKGQKEIGEYLEVHNPKQVTSILSRLKARGLITKNPTDSRWGLLSNQPAR